MKKQNILKISALLLASLMVGCVDNDYDLSKDIDMTVQVGGDHLTIPTSNTKIYTLEQILNLNEEDSSIKADASGNYSLQQSGSPTDTRVTVDEVNVKETESTGSESRAVFPTIPAGGLPAGIMLVMDIGGTGDGNFSQGVPTVVNKLNIDSDDVPEDIVEVMEATMDLDFTASVSFDATGYNGPFTFLEGFTILFDDDLTVVPMADYITSAAPNKIVFNRDYFLEEGASMKVPVSVTHINIPSDQGIMPNHEFRYYSNVESSGRVALDATKAEAGSNIAVDILINTSVAQGGVVTEVYGIINPKVDIEDSTFEITDIPEFLQDDSTRLNLENPQIYLTVDNSSPCEVTVYARLASYKAGRLIGSEEISPTVQSGHNVVCISPMRPDDPGVTVWEEAPDLSSLFAEIPDYVECIVERTQVAQVPYHFVLGGEGYQFKVETLVSVPLVFGEGTHLRYSDDSDDWKEDDLKKINFNRVEITAKVVNSVPMSFTPSVKPLLRNADGSTVSVDTHDCVLAPGTIENPSVTDLLITLTGEEGGNLGNLYGVEYIFEGFDPIAGEGLNKDQGIRLDDIQVSIIGGISYDLN